MKAALSLAAGLMALCCSLPDIYAEESSRIDDDNTFAAWIPVTASAGESDVYEVNAGRTFAPERVREVRVWVDTTGLSRDDDLCEDGDKVACPDFIAIDELRKQEVFKGQTRYANTTAVETVDGGEVFIFRETDQNEDFNRVKRVLLDGKFHVRISASSPGEYALARVHVSVHMRPMRKR